VLVWLYMTSSFSYFEGQAAPAPGAASGRAAGGTIKPFLTLRDGHSSCAVSRFLYRWPHSAITASEILRNEQAMNLPGNAAIWRGGWRSPTCLPRRLPLRTPSAPAWRGLTRRWPLFPVSLRQTQHTSSRGCYSEKACVVVPATDLRPISQLVPPATPRQQHAARYLPMPQIALIPRWHQRATSPPKRIYAQPLPAGAHHLPPLPAAFGVYTRAGAPRYARAIFISDAALHHSYSP